MAPTLHTDVLAVGETTYTWVDIQDAPELQNWWASAEAAATTSRAALREHQAAGTAPSDEDIHHAGVTFRRERRLLAADDLRSWLETWGLTVDEWKATLAASLARELNPGNELELEGTALTSDDVWAFVAVTGSIDTALEIFAVQRACELAGTDLDTVLASATTPIAIAAELDRHRVEWTTVNLTVLDLAHHDAGREALMTLNYDGEAPAATAERAHTSPLHTTLRVEDLATAQRGDALSTPLGQAIGPYETDDSWQVLVVHERNTPTEQDHGVRQRVTDLLTERAMEQLLEAHVSWLGEWL